MILQLNPPIPMSCPKGKGLAHFVIDYGPEHDLLWVIFLKNGDCWTYKNSLIQADSNETYGRKAEVAYHEKSIDRFGVSFMPC